AEDGIRDLIVTGVQTCALPIFDAQLQRHSTKPALVWDGGAITFDELRRRVDDFAGALAAKGVGASDRIALTIGNHWAFAVALLRSEERRVGKERRSRGWPDD